ncbi:MAG: phosphotransferase [Symploca sp. SIO1A3]|nr:phosphotransferase [Symploca sp. SIO1A3]
MKPTVDTLYVTPDIPTMTDNFNLDQLKQELYKPLTQALDDQASVGEISLLCPLKPVMDDSAKLLVKDTAGHPIAVVLCSSPVTPGLVARGMERTRLVKQALGSDIGRVVLDPLLEGKINGLSYAVLPHCQPLSSSRLIWPVQRTLLSPHVFQWLSRVTEVTANTVHAEQVEPDFIVPLKYLAELEAMTERVRAGAQQVLQRLADGKWSPRHVVMHNDLWKGNILLEDRNVSGLGKQLSTEHFIIIDWMGAMVQGYAMYDLIRLAQSLKLGGRQLREHVTTHCQFLGCDFIDARSHLLAALGYLGMHLEHFPLPRFVQMADSCLEKIEQIQG